MVLSIGRQGHCHHYSVHQTGSHEQILPLQTSANLVITVLLGYTIIRCVCNGLSVHCW